jgi:transposase
MLEAGQLSDYWLASWFKLLLGVGEALGVLRKRYRTPGRHAHPVVAAELLTYWDECRQAVMAVKAEARRRGVSLVVPWSVEDPEPWIQDGETRSRRIREASARGGAKRKGTRSAVRLFLHKVLEQIQSEIAGAHRAEVARRQALAALGPRKLKTAPAPVPKASAAKLWERLNSTGTRRAMVDRAARECGVRTWSLGEYNKILEYRTAAASGQLTYKSIQHEVTAFHRQYSGRS